MLTLCKLTVGSSYLATLILSNLLTALEDKKYDI